MVFTRAAFAFPPMTSPLEQRAAAYLAKMPHAISGAAGHATTFAAACRLVEFGLPFERALFLLLMWNETHCWPKWTAAALRHKLMDAFKRTAPKSQFVAGRGVTVPGPVTPASHAPWTVTPPPPTSKPAIAAALEQFIERLSGQSSIIAVSKPACLLAAQRSLSIGALMNAWGMGLLRFDCHLGVPAWFVLDSSRRNACARRMDGRLWFEGTANACKSVILSGSQAKWPIGISEARPYPKILLCEGAPDLLAAFHFIGQIGRHKEFAPVAMLSGSYPIHTDALRLFKGKRVRIFAHNDMIGGQAAQKWKEQIAGHVMATDIFNFPMGVKDLNDFARSQFSTAGLLP